jgi:hypothetical protein
MAIISVDKATAAGRRRDDLVERWIHSLGLLAYLFGQLEWLSYGVLERYAPATLTHDARELPFSKRTALAAKAVRTHFAAAKHAALRKRWSSFFADLKIAGRDRNKFLHSPLMMDIFVDAAGDYQVVDRIVPMRDTSAASIPLQEVDLCCARFDALCMTMV